MIDPDIETLKDLLEFCIYHEQKSKKYMEDCEKKREVAHLKDEHMVMHAESFLKYLKLADRELDQYRHYLEKHMEEAGEKWD